MMHRKLAAPFTFAAVTAALCLCVAGSAAVSAPGHPVVGAAGPVAAAAQAAPGRTGPGAIPRRGTGVLVEAALSDGTNEAATVTTAGTATAGTTSAGTATAGTTSAGTAGTDAAQLGPVGGLARSVSVAGTAACTDVSYTLEGFRVSRSLPFYYNGAGVPASVRTGALAAIRGAAYTVATGANRCAAARKVNAGATYSGTTRRTAQLNSAGRCTGNDGYNVASWGMLPAGYLAITCVYFSAGKVLNSDVLISTRYRWFTSRPANCRNTYDLQSVITHEQGHTFGLGHVDPNRHGTQTMAASLMACDTSKRALGMGDYRGLVRIYGTR
jgi:hypothetical protein